MLSNVDTEKKELQENNCNNKINEINNKNKRFYYKLYDAIPSLIKTQSHNNRSEKNLKLKAIEDNLDSYNNPYGSSTKKNVNKLYFNSNFGKEYTDGLDNESNQYPFLENIDLFTVLPNEFFEIPYVTALKNKKVILENVNKKLLEYKSIKDKDYKDFLNIVNHAIDDLNILVNLEGIKLLKNFCKLSKTINNQSKLKNLLVSCYDKFKDKKTNVKLELFDLFNTIITNRIFTFEQLLVFKLQHVLTQKNPIVKINILEYAMETLSKYDKASKRKVDTKCNLKSKIKSDELKLNVRSLNRVKNFDFRDNPQNGI